MQIKYWYPIVLNRSSSTVYSSKFNIFQLILPNVGLYSMEIDYTSTSVVNVVKSTSHFINVFATGVGLFVWRIFNQLISKLSLATTNITSTKNILKLISKTISSTRFMLAGKSYLKIISFKNQHGISQISIGAVKYYIRTISVTSLSVLHITKYISKTISKIISSSKSISFNAVFRFIRNRTLRFAPYAGKIQSIFGGVTYINGRRFYVALPQTNRIPKTYSQIISLTSHSTLSFLKIALFEIVLHVSSTLSTLLITSKRAVKNISITSIHSLNLKVVNNFFKTISKTSTTVMNFLASREYFKSYSATVNIVVDLIKTIDKTILMFIFGRTKPGTQHSPTSPTLIFRISKYLNIISSIRSTLNIHFTRILSKISSSHITYASFIIFFMVVTAVSDTITSSTKQLFVFFNKISISVVNVIRIPNKLIRYTSTSIKSFSKFINKIINIQSFSMPALLLPQQKAVNPAEVTGTVSIIKFPTKVIHYLSETSIVISAISFVYKSFSIVSTMAVNLFKGNSIELVKTSIALVFMGIQRAIHKVLSYSKTLTILIKSQRMENVLLNVTSVSVKSLSLVKRKIENLSVTSTIIIGTFLKTLHKNLRFIISNSVVLNFTKFLSKSFTSSISITTKFKNDFLARVKKIISNIMT